MSEHDEIEPGLRELDGHLREAAAPPADGVRRVRDRLLAAIEGDGGPARWLRARWPLVAAAAAAVLLLGAGVAGGAALAGRTTGANGVATVVPGTGGGGQDAGGSAPLPSSGSGAAAQKSQTAGAAPQPSTGGAIVTACPAGPTVQLQSRGLVVTGVGVVPTSGASDRITFSVGIQEQGTDQAGLTTRVQARLAAVQDALAAAGVPRANIDQTSMSSYGGPNTQVTVSGSVEARLTSQDQLTAATRAVAQQGGTVSYSSSTTPGDDPSSADVQTAVTAAAGQARDMAAATARATNQTLGAVQGVVTQPPQLCYGSDGPARIVQVTVTYALK